MRYLLGILNPDEMMQEIPEILVCLCLIRAMRTCLSHGGSKGAEKALFGLAKKRVGGKMLLGKRVWTSATEIISHT